MTFKAGNWYAILGYDNDVLNLMLFSKKTSDGYVFDTYFIEQDRLFLGDVWLESSFRKDGAHITEFNLKSDHKRKIISVVLRGRIREN